MTAARAPLLRNYNRRHIKGLGHTGVLRPDDATRSIEDRKAKDTIREKRRLDRQYKKVYGKAPPKQPTEENKASIEAARAAEQANELFYLDSHPMR
ncbi:transposase [Penicillium maclennaniae]|uniref:transposase n=1 Tax=Penicillium maclennaniae TaxID=1343394 RepID=UPI0025421F4F|nr:transposase [Penicillium maclennaniae]KAJ5670864.1 transposase [Penicillium maclennaniae]